MTAPSMELFDQYFRLADLDRDGRISGGEAVAFSQGSNLPKHVLAQIWMHADQNKTGFLGRQEFYNFLKLVTVAQSGRELTPDIVKAALFGPAAARIPAPKINAVPVPSSQMSSTATPRPQLGSTMPSSNQTGAAVLTSQNVGFRGPQVSPNMGTNQQVTSSLNNNFMRPYQPTPAAPPPMLGATQGLTGGGNMMGPRPPPAAGVSTSIRAPGLPTSPQAPSGSATPLSPKPIDSAMFQSFSNASKALVPSGNGFSSDAAFGGNSFSATQAKSAVFTSTFSAGSMPDASGTASAAAGSPNVVKPAQPDPFKNNLTLPQGGGQLQQPHSAVKQNQLNAVPDTSASSASGIFVTAGGSADGQGQAQWPKVTQSDVKKYTKVFVEVDKDRDGKITGEEARNLFLSWRLPREVLKQVWDLSDQDNDSMLSLREFCIALYLMERYREGRPLPSELPNNLRYDETLLQVTGQPSTTYGGSSWQMSPGLSQQGIPGPRPFMPAAGVRTVAQSSVGSVSGSAVQMSQDMPKSPVFERNLQNQSEKVEQDALVASNDDNKVEESKKILDYREKVEFYRTKMQDLVLYKSRCENRLNEISERASADKREVESLAKKYEEKYKQVADVASKLTVEEATLRHVQERKVELQNALVKMEQGGSVDGLLQVRADRIQSDLEELAKALCERSKKHGIDVKTTASVELPFGWQPGIQEGAVDWDEEWDKFDDEGFAIAKELSVGVDNAAAPAENPPSVWGDEVFDDEVSPVESSSHIFSNAVENGSADAHSEDGSTRSPRGSPGRIAFDSPAREFHSPLHDASPHAKDSYSDHTGAESTFSGDKFADDSSVWGANFDTSDDVDSVWGFNTKDTGHSSFFDSGDFGLNPIKVDSPTSSNDFSKEKKISVFADSVPSSPLFNSSSPSRFTERPDDRSFDASSRFDSFNMQDSGFFNQRGNVARFDSMRSTADFDHSRGFSFDDGDPFGSTGPFKSSTESHSPSKGSDNWNAF